MTTLTSAIDPRSAEFRANATSMQAQVADLRVRVATIEEGGGPKARERHLARGKLLAHARDGRLVAAPHLMHREIQSLGRLGERQPLDQEQGQQRAVL